jgi:hypothetical protein
VKTQFVFFRLRHVEFEVSTRIASRRNITACQSGKATASFVGVKKFSWHVPRIPSDDGDCIIALNVYDRLASGCIDRTH